jgi:hypothetical protein
MQLRLPWFESISVGTIASATSSALLAGYKYSHFSSPLSEPAELWGFHANFSSVNVLIQMYDTDKRDVWSPFFSTEMGAVFGDFDQVSPVLLLPEPYLIQPTSRIQFFIQNIGVVNISQTIITLVGVRLKEAEGYVAA